MQRLLLLLLLISVGVYGMVLPQRAAASGYPVFDAAALEAKITDIGIKIGQFAQTVAKWVKEDLAKSIRDIIAKRILDYIVDQTVQWVQGGGQPKYVTDWNGFLKDTANIAFDQVMKDAGLARLCSPFGLQLRILLAPVQRFQQRLDCTIDQVVANIQNFYVDFRQGGWIAYNSLWQPNNNYYGAQLIVADQVLIDTARKTQAATNDARSGGGFLNIQKCVDPVYTTKTTVSPVCSENEPETGNCISYRSETKTEQVQTGCNKYETQTPGSVIGKAVGDAITSDSKWAANIQSWTAALVNAAINRLITEGLGAMRNAIAGGGDSYRPPEYASLVTQEIESQKRQLVAQAQKFLDEEQYLLNAKTKAVIAAGDAVTSLQSLSARGCAPPVTASDIAAAQNNVVTLSAQQGALQAAVDELSAAMNGVIQATDYAAINLKAEQLTAVTDKYNTATFQKQLLDGSGRQAADQELRAFQAQDTGLQDRVRACIATASSTRQMPGSTVTP